MSSKNNCLLAIDVSMLENNNYDNAFEKAPKACIDATGLTICWDDFEKKPSKYKLVIKLLEIGDLYYVKLDLKAALTISVIDTNQR